MRRVPRPMFPLGSLAAAVAAVALQGGTAHASADGVKTREVRAMLSAYERGPDAEAWRALGPETLEALVTLYNDPSQPRYVRIRAVSAAAHFPSPAARTFLLAVARTPGQYDLMVRQAVKALERAFGEGVLDPIRPFLEHDSPAVREVTAACLGRIGTPAASRALRARLGDEPRPVVREAIRRALKRSRVQ